MATRDRPGVLQPRLPEASAPQSLHRGRCLPPVLLPENGGCLGTPGHGAVSPWLWEALERDRLLAERRAGKGRLSTVCLPARPPKVWAAPRVWAAGRGQGGGHKDRRADGMTDGCGREDTWVHLTVAVAAPEYGRSLGMNGEGETSSVNIPLAGHVCRRRGRRPQVLEEKEDAGRVPDRRKPGGGSTRIERRRGREEALVFLLAGAHGSHRTTGPGPVAYGVVRRVSVFQQRGAGVWERWDIASAAFAPVCAVGARTRVFVCDRAHVWLHMPCLGVRDEPATTPTTEGCGVLCAAVATFQVDGAAR